MATTLLINPKRKAKKRKATKKRRTTAKRKTTTKRKVARRAPTKRKAPARRKLTTKRAVPRRKVSGVKTMAKKRTYKKRSPRKNPSRRRRVYKKAISRAKSTFAGLNIKGAVKNTLPMLAGMMAAKWTAKRFGEAATETDPATWNYMSYLKAAAGGVAAAFVAQNIRRGTGQKVLEGAFAYVGFKIIHNELIPNSEWAQDQFGASDYSPTEYQPGSIELNSAGQPYMLGEDYQWRPYQQMGGGQMQKVGPLGGGDLQPVGKLGAVDYEKHDQAYREAQFKM